METFRTFECWGDLSVDLVLKQQSIVLKINVINTVKHFQQGEYQ